MTISGWEAATEPLGQMVEQERRRNAALQAERDRLREALEAVIKCDEYWGGSAGEVAEIARAALALRLEDFGAVSNEALAKEGQ
jgi:hypothetical protein